MSMNIRKILLAGTAILAVGATSGQAFAQTEIDATTITATDAAGLIESNAVATQTTIIDPSAGAITIGADGTPSFTNTTGQAINLVIGDDGGTGTQTVTLADDVIQNGTGGSTNITIGEAGTDNNATLVLQGNATETDGDITITIGDGTAEATNNTATLTVQSILDENVVVAADVAGDGTGGDTAVLNIVNTADGGSDDTITFSGTVGATNAIDQINIGAAAGGVVTNVIFTGTSLNATAIDFADDTAAGNLTLNNAAGTFSLGNVTGGDLADSIIITDGTVTAGTVALGAGADALTLTAGSFDATSVDLGAGGNNVQIDAGTFGASAHGFTVTGGINVDTVTVNGGTVNADFSLGDGADVVLIDTGASTINGDINLGNNANSFTVNDVAAVLNGDITGGDNIDTIDLGNAATLNGDLSTGAAADSLTISGGTHTGNIDLGANDDTLDINGGTYNGTITLGDGADTTVTVAGATFNGVFNADGGASTDDTDTVTVDGGTVAFNANIIGVGSLAVDDGATLNLNIGAANTYAGSVDDGTAGDQTVTVASGTYTGAFDLGAGTTDTITVSGGDVGAAQLVSTATTKTLNLNTDTTFAGTGDVDGFDLIIGNNATVTVSSTAGGGTGLGGTALDGLTIGDGSTLIANNDVNAGANALVNNGALTIGEGVTVTATGGYSSDAAAGITFDLVTTAGTTTGGTLATAAAQDFSNTTISITGAAATGQTVASVFTGDEILTAEVAALQDSYLFDYELVANGGNTDLTVAANNTLASALTNTGNTAAATEIASLIAAGSSDAALQSFLDSVANATTAEEANALIEAVLPTLDGGALAAAINVSSQNNTVIGQRLAALRGFGEQGSGVAAGDGNMGGVKAWGQLTGTTGEQDERDGVDGYDIDGYGLAFGFDKEIDSKSTLGVAVAYANTDVDSKDSASTETEVDTYQITLYGEHKLDDVTYLNGQIGYAHSQNDVTRTSPTARSFDFDANTYTVAAELGRAYKAGKNAEIVPHVGLSYLHYDADAYTDPVAGGVRVDLENLNKFEAIIGADLEYTMNTENGTVVKPYLSADFAYDMVGDEVEATSQFLGGGSAFTTEGFDSQDERFNVGAGVTFFNQNQWEFSADYDYEIRADYDAHSGRLRASYNF